MAFHESNNLPFAKKGFSPTDRLRGFHLHINRELLGVKKRYSVFQITAAPVPWKGAGSSLPTVQPCKEKQQAGCSPWAMKIWGIWVSPVPRWSLTTRSSVHSLFWVPKGSWWVHSCFGLRQRNESNRLTFSPQQISNTQGERAIQNVVTVSKIVGSRLILIPWKCKFYGRESTAKSYVAVFHCYRDFTATELKPHPLFQQGWKPVSALQWWKQVKLNSKQKKFWLDQWWWENSNWVLLGAMIKN